MSFVLYSNVSLVCLTPLNRSNVLPPEPALIRPFNRDGWLEEEKILGPDVVAALEASKLSGPEHIREEVLLIVKAAFKDANCDPVYEFRGDDASVVLELLLDVRKYLFADVRY